MYLSETQAHPILLVIDDEVASTALLVSLLKTQDVEILVATSGADGLKKAVFGQPDLILLDVRMADMDGIATCRKLKADPRTADIPVIFLSASTDMTDKLEGFRAGGNDYVEKPFHREELLARVSIQLRIRRHMLEARELARPSAASETRTVLSREDQLFDKALSLIQEHLSEPISVEEIASRLGTNKEKLTTIFRARVGISLAEYAMDIRLNLSKQYVAETEMQIQQIAVLAGYRNAGDFSRAFRRRFGVTPLNFRQCLVNRAEN